MAELAKLNARVTDFATANDEATAAKQQAVENSMVDQGSNRTGYTYNYGHGSLGQSFELYDADGNYWGNCVSHDGNVNANTQGSGFGGQNNGNYGSGNNRGGFNSYRGIGGSYRFNSRVFPRGGGHSSRGGSRGAMLGNNNQGNWNQPGANHRGGHTSGGGGRGRGGGPGNHRGGGRGGHHNNYDNNNHNNNNNNNNNNHNNNNNNNNNYNNNRRTFVKCEECAKTNSFCNHCSTCGADDHFRDTCPKNQ